MWTPLPPIQKHLYLAVNPRHDWGLGLQEHCSCSGHHGQNSKAKSFQFFSQSVMVYTCRLQYGTNLKLSPTEMSELPLLLCILFVLIASKTILQAVARGKESFSCRVSYHILLASWCTVVRSKEAMGDPDKQ